MSDTLADVTPQLAMRNLADLHDLPTPQALTAKRINGNTTVFLRVRRDHAEAWRSALAAPPFAEDTEADYPAWSTTGLLLGAKVELRYTH